jgi:hypothetical protein
MIIDEVVVDRIVYLQKAFPSKSDDIEWLTKYANEYFSKVETEQRVSILCKAMLDGKVSGKMLYYYYPLFLFFSNSYRDGRKIIFNKEQTKSIERFKQACIGFGIPSHLKKHGNSDKRIFRVLPSFKELSLDKVRKGEIPLSSELWASVWEFLIEMGYICNESLGFWKIRNSQLKFPATFWKKAIANMPRIKSLEGWKPKKITKLKDKDLCVEFEIVGVGI